MSWIKLDDGFSDHPKIMGLASDSLRWFHVRALCYAAKYRTGGVITPAILRGLGGKPGHATALVDAGLWDPADGGAWQIHDFEEYNPQGSERRADPHGLPLDPELSAKRAEAGRKGGILSWQSRSKRGDFASKQTEASGEANGKQTLLPRTAARGRPVPSRPVPSPNPSPGNTPTTSSSSSLPSGAEPRRDDDDDGQELPEGAVLILSALRLRRIEPHLRDDAQRLAEEASPDSIRAAIEACKADNVKPWPDDVRARLPRDTAQGWAEHKRQEWIRDWLRSNGGSYGAGAEAYDEWIRTSTVAVAK